MNYRITIIKNDGCQERIVTDAPNYVSLERSLQDNQIKSFIVTKA